ncbi:ABC transporter substrate-binding protein [Noviherbaspirillum galbum]|uniref:ABC transporter substrate-binding protein n=1 Tax=Noviherbaspirillum galbum TaxID=2709383 RepID=A0A6B3SUP4_9BURK|nr:ABC transporter substrate-binding protein [Noviherbaspirillum galbum]NEX62082.1 ABC transporter substrate-binding protein [Noviherbaspirillum galbum]
MTYERIACLSTEAVETLYALGAQDRIAGISGFTVRPPEARRDKPKISGFSSSRIERILAVRPDLVIGYSNLQADILRDLAQAGVEVHLFNQHDVGGIFRMIATLSALVDRRDEGEGLCARLRAVIDATKQAASGWTRRPRMYFEEWNDPLISGIGWVSELMTIAGGTDVFADLAGHHGARDRIIADGGEVVRRAPDIIVASWCGKKFQHASLVSRPGWDAIPAVRSGSVAEIKSPDILSPGPSAITHGLPQLHALVAAWQASHASRETA